MINLGVLREFLINSFPVFMCSESAERPSGAGQVPPDRPDEAGGRVPSDGGRDDRPADGGARRRQKEAREDDHEAGTLRRTVQEATRRHRRVLRRGAAQTAQLQGLQQRSPVQRIWYKHSLNYHT